MKRYIISFCLCIILIICSLSYVSSCNKYYEALNKKRVEEIKCNIELKITHLRIYNIFRYDQIKPDNIARLRHKFEEEGYLSFFDTYGQENLFFNTNTYLWVKYSKISNEENSKDEDMKKLAVALRMESDKYLCIRFDGTGCKTNALSSELHNTLIDEE